VWPWQQHGTMVMRHFYVPQDAVRRSEQLLAAACSNYMPGHRLATSHA
jgi:hypothetical protein